MYLLSIKLYTINGNYKINIVEHYDEPTIPQKVNTGIDVLSTIATDLTNGKYYTNTINFTKNENMYIKKENDSIDMINSLGSINIKSKAVDGKQGDVTFTGKKININGELCIGNTCINEQQLNDIKKGYFDTVETNNIYIRNGSTNKNMPKIRMYAGSEYGANIRPELAIVTDNEQNWGGLYIQPGNKSDTKSNIIMSGGNERSEVLVNNRDATVDVIKVNKSIYIKNTNDKVPNIHLYAGSEANQGKRAELGIITEGTNLGNAGVYLKPGNDSLLSKITVTGNRTFKDW